MKRKEREEGGEGEREGGSDSRLITMVMLIKKVTCYA